MEQNTSNKGLQTTRYRKLSPINKLIVGIFCLFGLFVTVNSIFQLGIAGFKPMASAYYYYFLACFLSIAFIVFPARRKVSQEVKWYDWLLFFASIISTVYLALHALEIQTQGWEFEAPLPATVMSCILWIVALEALRRSGGVVLFFMALLFSVYPLFASKMPGFLYGTPFTIEEVITYHAMGLESIIGLPMRAMCNLIMGFLIFGAILAGTGGGKFFMDFASALLGSQRGGPAKVSIIASGFFGSLSGSVPANVVTTGSMTIPAMKKLGYPSEYAGALECCASSGGSLMPPIMGTAAFLIAMFLDIPYLNVCAGALVPSLLYYISLLVQTDCFAARTGLKGLNKSEIPSVWSALKEGWFYIFSFGVLVYFLFVVRNEAWAPFYTLPILLACTMLRKETRLNREKIFQLMTATGLLLTDLTAILAGVGLIVGALIMTGVGNSLANGLVSISHGNIFFLLLLGAATSFILGMGMTVSACYILLAIVLAPALVSMGLDPLATHLFVMYWGILSYLTPPVATAAITASGIAQASPMRIAFTATRLALIKYILPFFFVANPTLILHGPIWNILLDVTTGFIGAVFISCSLEGYLYKYGDLKMIPRAFVFISGVLLLWGDLYTDFLGVAILVLLLSAHKVQSRRLENRNALEKVI